MGELVFSYSNWYCFSVLESYVLKTLGESINILNEAFEWIKRSASSSNSYLESQIPSDPKKSFQRFSCSHLSWDGNPTIWVRLSLGVIWEILLYPATDGKIVIVIYNTQILWSENSQRDKLDHYVVVLHQLNKLRHLLQTKISEELNLQFPRLVSKSSKAQIQRRKMNIEKQVWTFMSCEINPSTRWGCKKIYSVVTIFSSSLNIIY